MSISSTAHTYPPEGGDSLGAVEAFLAAHEHTDPAARQHYLLSAPGSGQGVEVPEQVLQVLRQVVGAMHSGQAVAVVPVAETVSTTQAAALLGVSRPTVVKLLEQGAMAYEQTRSHRRIDLSEVLAYRQARHEAQHADLDALGGGDDEPVDQMLARLKTTRAILAKRRHAAESATATSTTIAS